MGQRLKDELDFLLKREAKAGKYLDDGNVPLEERLKWVGEYQKILNRINELKILIVKGIEK